MDAIAQLQPGDLGFEGTPQLPVPGDGPVEVGGVGAGGVGRAQQRALADQYQVVIIDRCGFGGSASLEAAGFAYAQGSRLRGAMGGRGRHGGQWS